MPRQQARFTVRGRVSVTWTATSGRLPSRSIEARPPCRHPEGQCASVPVCQCLGGGKLRVFVRIGLAMAHGAVLLASRVGGDFTVTCSSESDAPRTTLLRSAGCCCDSAACEAWAVTGRGRSQITHSLPWWMLDLLTVGPLYPPHPKPAEGFRLDSDAT